MFWQPHDYRAFRTVKSDRLLENVDADMASILRDNWDVLITIVRNGERDARARTDFNAKVAEALDTLVKWPPPKAGV